MSMNENSGCVVYTSNLFEHDDFDVTTSPVATKAKDASWRFTPCQRGPSPILSDVSHDNMNTLRQSASSQHLSIPSINASPSGENLRDKLAHSTLSLQGSVAHGDWPGGDYETENERSDMWCDTGHVVGEGRREEGRATGQIKVTLCVGGDYAFSSEVCNGFRFVLCAPPFKCK